MSRWLEPIQRTLSHGLVRRLIWVLFAIVFYQSGLTATVWLLEPETFRGGIDWLWLALFPVLLPLFFVVNRVCGCASGACAIGDKGSRTLYTPPP
jgi:hypothetical protein